MYVPATLDNAHIAYPHSQAPLRSLIILFLLHRVKKSLLTAFHTASNKGWDGGLGMRLHTVCVDNYAVSAHQILF